VFTPNYKLLSDGKWGANFPVRHGCTVLSRGERNKRKEADGEAQGYFVKEVVRESNGGKEVNHCAQGASTRTSLHGSHEEGVKSTTKDGALSMTWMGREQKTWDQSYRGRCGP